jgi:DNA-binding CsgD family transcriptional regulator
MLIAITVSLDVLSLFACVLLGINRSKTLVAAAFVYSIISIVQIPVVYFIAVVIQPLTDMRNLLEAAVQFPLLYYSGLFFNNIIITVCCLLAASWLRETKINPSLKIRALFSLTFILISLIVLVWWSDIITVTSISFLFSAFLGTLLLGILILLMYLYTRISFNNNLSAGKDDYIQFAQLLSKRELEVIEAILAGNDSYKKLTAALNISTNTVKTHLRHIYQTTGVSNIAALSSLFSGFTSNHP